MSVIQRSLVAYQHRSSSLKECDTTGVRHVSGEMERTNTGVGAQQLPQVVQLQQQQPIGTRQNHSMQQQGNLAVSSSFPAVM